MKFVNLTPHTINIRKTDGTELAIPSSGLARVATTPGTVTEVDGICFTSAPQYGIVEGLHDPAPDTVYIVSQVVLARVKRSDVFAPGTGPNDGAVRNDKGLVTAVTRLVGSV